MNATLLVVAGNTTKRKVALKLPCVLGRSREADVTVPHPLVSRRHCELSQADGLLMLRDLVSLNGTMIGGRRITSAPLLPDAEFTIGPLTFRVMYNYDGDSESLPPINYVDGVADADVSAEPDSPWATEAPEVESAKRPATKQKTSSEHNRAAKTPPAITKQPNYGDEVDPEFGSYFEDLR